MPVEIAALADVEIVATGLSFPEGPVVLPDGSVLVCELAARRVSRVDLTDGSVSEVAETGGGPNGAALGPDGALYVCNNGGLGEAKGTAGIQRVDLRTGAVEWLYTSSDGAPFLGPNDIVFDADGGFWFTDLLGGTIHHARADGSGAHTVVRAAHQPNGIGLSPDGSILYWAETVSRQVHRRRVVAPGQVARSPGYDVLALMRRGGLDPWTLLVGMDGMQQFDSLAVDSSGNVCVGTLVESGITVVAPDGSRVVRHTLPAHAADRMVTNLCFGGPDLGTAYVTLSETGRLAACPWPVPGLQLAFG